jgi:hypothetical protein
MTTQGADGPLDATLRIEAEEACSLLGQVRVSTDADGGSFLTSIRHEDRVTYKYLDFRSAPKKLRLRLKPGTSDCTIQVHLGHVWHRRIATALVKGAPSGDWTEIVCDVAATSGVHAVVLQFQGKGDSGLVLDWWRFE